MKRKYQENLHAYQGLEVVSEVLDALIQIAILSLKIN